MGRPVLALEISIEMRAIPSTQARLAVISRCGTWQTFDVGSSATERTPITEALRMLVKGGGPIVDTLPMYDGLMTVCPEEILLHRMPLANTLN
jgi:hypothetical protein